MPYTTEHLYGLLPAIYRIRDAEQGYPLRGLIAVIAQQASVMEEDITQLYENAFIETCDEWVMPYIGDLLGVRGLHPIAEAGFSQRARVANTLGLRRRKGTAAMLEQLARDSTGWPARVVEYFQLLQTTQYANHIRPRNLRTPDLRDANALELLDGPFDTVAHTVDVRHIDVARAKHNLMNVGIFLWRLRACPISRAPAFSHGDGRFSFSQLGHDAPLFNHPALEVDPAHLAQEWNVPGPIRRRALHASLSGPEEAEHYYGENSSLQLWSDGKDVPRTKIVACDLSGWQHRPDAEQIAVDPVLGRIAFPSGAKPRDVQVAYYHGLAGEIGGGGYPRTAPELSESTVRYGIAKSSSIDSLQKAVRRWTSDGRRDAVFEIEDNGIYEEPVRLAIPAGRTLCIRAADQRRPLLRLSDPLEIEGAAGESGGQLVLEGLLISGHRIEIHAGDLQALQLNHCTLVPGWALTSDGNPVAPGNASLVTRGANPRLNVTLHRSISGRLVLPDIERLSLTDSLVDGIEGDALLATRLRVEQSTLLGPVRATVIEHASNSIFSERVSAERKQEGCVRFCYIPLHSSVPRRYRCAPGRVRPRFTSSRYGEPGYGQLHIECAAEIQRGADDQNEMGVFHHQQQQQRETNLRTSLGEYLRVGLEAGLFYVT